MARGISIFLSVTLLLLLDVHLALSECNYIETMNCLEEKLSELEQEANLEDLCQDFTSFYQAVDSCSDLALIMEQCNEEQMAQINAKQDVVRQAYTVKCDSIIFTTTTAAPPECDSDEGWELAVNQISDCLNVYTSLSEYEYSFQLTEYAVCKNTQDMINCLLGNATLNRCQQYKETFYRELIPRIKFAHLFNCELKIEDSPVNRINPDSDCDILEWLACHNDLLQALPNVDQVSAGYNLNQLVELSVSDITKTLAKDPSGCSQYRSVNWPAIDTCRRNLVDKCYLLEEPSRDPLWSGVLDVMYDLKTKLSDKLYTLMNIEEICADECDDLMARITMIETECKSEVGLMAPDDVINKFNSDQDVSAECNKINTFKSCLTGRVIKSCTFLEQSVVFNLHLDNKWKLALDICQTDHDITSDPRCDNQRVTEDKILTECSFQENIDRRTNLLNREYDQSTFCGYLQLATICYQQNVAQCSALEREYWAAELPLMDAANQMITGCSVNLNIYGQMKVKPINAGTCDWAKWVVCLSDLWDALGVSYTRNVLSLEGFKSLLEIVWDDGSQQAIADRCLKIQNLNFDGMEQCVRDISCQYPMLTFPDGEDHKLALRNPFDVTQLKEHVNEVCKPACSEEDVAEKYQYCLDIENDQGLLTTYPKDIIAGGYRKFNEETKCRKLSVAKGCVDYYLDPNKCALFESSVFETKAITEAIEVCDWLRTQLPPPNSETSAAATFSPVFSLLVIAIFYSTFP